MLSAIATAAVEDFRDDMAVRYAPTTVNGMITCMSSAFSTFRRRRWIQNNPGGFQGSCREKCDHAAICC